MKENTAHAPKHQFTLGPTGPQPRLQKGQLEPKGWCPLEFGFLFPSFNGDVEERHSGSWKGWWKNGSGEKMFNTRGLLRGALKTLGTNPDTDGVLLPQKQDGDLTLLCVLGTQPQGRVLPGPEGPS